MVYRPTGGEISFRGRPSPACAGGGTCWHTAARCPMVFQDPFSSLNPAHTVGYTDLRGLKLHRPELDRQQRQAEAERVLEVVGLVPPRRLMLPSTPTS